MATTSKSTRTRATSSEDGKFTAEERAAMKERAAEIKAEKSTKARGKAGRSGRAAAEAQVCLDKIAELPGDDRTIAEGIHAIATDEAVGLAAKTWYGMPAYAKDGKIVCFFQPADKFKARYATLGFNDPAALDDGDFWATSFAVLAWTPAVEEKVRTLITTSVG
jgi:uncharacterized protein YdhG (YjbR/CyaY superfamily)